MTQSKICDSCYMNEPDPKCELCAGTTQYTVPEPVVNASSCPHEYRSPVWVTWTTSSGAKHSKEGYSCLLCEHTIVPGVDKDQIE